MKIILLSSVYNKTAYKRRPSSLYGADDYIEKHHLPDDLTPKIRRLTSREETTASAVPHPDQYPADWEEMNETIRSAEEQEVSASEKSEALEKARRLARIIVSDIALYNQDKVEEGVAAGTFFEVLAPEVAEGRRLFEERIAP